MRLRISKIRTYEENIPTFFWIGEKSFPAIGFLVGVPLKGETDVLRTTFNLLQDQVSFPVAKKTGHKARVL